MREKTSISIVLVFYNAEQYIKEAINSILNQSFKDYELLLINDGSTDKSVAFIREFTDKRIRLIHNNHNYIQSLNIGLKNAGGKYIARMDADDIMHPDRLLVQYSLMEDKPEIDFCSSWYALFSNNNGPTLVCNKYSGKITDPLVSMLQKNIFMHPGMMFKTDFIIKNKLKYLYYNHAEDYKLWVDAAKSGALFYIEPQVLLYYRVHKQQISYKYSKIQEESSFRIKDEIMKYLLPRIPEEIKNLYETLCSVESKGLVKSGYRFTLLYDILKYNNIKI